MKELKKIIVVPDSFKGGMSSERICALVEKAVNEHYPRTQVVKIPVADGGEGTVDAMLAACGGEKIALRVKGPFFEEIDSFYAMLPDNIAVIEMAAAAGLPLARERLNPLKATTYGVGQLMLAAYERGARHIILGMGGSATNDAGCGAAAALGAKFYDAQGAEFVPVGETLCKIDSIDVKGVALPVDVTAMCDIDNPLFGEKGAAYVFAPQKGADESAVKLLDDGLRHFAQKAEQYCKVNVSDCAGTGAAGGLGAGALCFFKATLKMGIEAVLDAAKFDDELKGASLVFTGEGKIDTQSLQGKVVIGVAARAKRAKVPVVAIVGDVGDNINAAYDMGVSAIFSINRVAVPFEKAVARSEGDLYACVNDILRLLKALQN